MHIFLAFAFVLVASAVAVVLAAALILVRESVRRKLVTGLVSYACGVLLSATFLGLLHGRAYLRSLVMLANERWLERTGPILAASPALATRKCAASERINSVSTSPRVESLDPTPQNKEDGRARLDRTSRGKRSTTAVISVSRSLGPATHCPADRHHALMQPAWHETLIKSARLRARASN